MKLLKPKTKNTSILSVIFVASAFNASTILLFRFILSRSVRLFKSKPHNLTWYVETRRKQINSNYDFKKLIMRESENLAHQLRKINP